MNRIPVRRRYRPRSSHFRLSFQRLEDRLAPATFTVTTLTDNIPGSLRSATTSANTTAGADTVTFQVGLIGTINLTSELAINEAVTIVGLGLGTVVVSGNNTSRVFNTSLAGGGAKISFINMIIVNGEQAGGNDGGGIFAVDEAITLTNCVVSGNSATDDGGAIVLFASPGSLTLLNCTFTNNHADGSGGVVQLGTGVVATITNCVMTGNTAGSRGGAIYGSDASLIITQSTLSGNSAAVGGGLAFRNTVGPSGLIVRNSTLSGNSATSTGGGIALELFSGTLAIENSTIANNTAGGSGGGGIGRVTGTGFIVLESSVVSGNTHTVGANEDLFTTGTVTAKYSAVFTTTGVTTFTPDNPSKYLVAVDHKLGTLSSNGGSTQTHVPAPDSPLINKGSNPAALTTDQRGGAANRNSNGGVDIGAVELQSFLVINSSNSGTGSFRQAVINANTLGGSDTVAFDPAIFASATTITLTTTEMAINDAVTITGPAAKLTINGNGVNRVFNTSGAAAKSAVSVSGLTLTGCKTSLSGGAIIVDDEALTLTNCVITGNTSGAGGGIYVNGTAGSLTLLGCTVSNNSTTGPDAEGGGIFMYSGSATIRDTTISGNTATGGGGGIVVYNGGSLLLENSTVSGNQSQAGDNGGGVYFFGTVAAGGLTIRNSTISGNTAGASGGAIALASFTGTLTVQNSTITSNTASGGNGGGIARVSGTGTVSLSSTIVAGNSNASTPDLSFNAATNVSENNNLVGVANVGNFTLTGSGNQTGTKASPLNAKLDSLASNGGPTKTHFPKPGSPVIDKGNNAIGLANDQRGSGFARVSDVADVGAVERLSTRVTNVLDSGSGSLRQAILNANANPNTFLTAETISFDPTVFATAQKITLTSGQIVVDDWLTVAGPSAQLTIDGNGGGRIFFVIATGANVLMQRLALTNGKVSGDGGAIAIGVSDLTLEDCSITNCSASGIGGAILSQGLSTSLLTIRRSTLSANTAAGGGAIAAGNDLSILDSTLSGNVATSNGGGALLLYRGSNITNSTLSGNSALGGAGGGLCLFDDSAHAAIRNCTITGNSAANNGGGIAQIGTYDDLTLSSTIVTGNFNSNSPDISFDYPAAVIGNNNLIGAADVGNFMLSGTGNQTGTLVSPLNAKLGPLATNGGPTKTHAPLPGSPAFDKGNDDAALVNDQRGVSFPRIIGGLTDVGAVESPSFVVSNNNNSGAGSLRQAVITANANSGPDTITFDAAFFATPKTITLTGRIAINEDVTISGPGAALATVFGNKFDRVFDTGGAKTGAAIAISGLTVSGGISNTDGGGIFVGDESVTMTQCTITGNTATRQGGGVFVDSNGVLTLVDCSITSNVANDSFGVQSSSGGGIYVLLGGSLTILNSTIAFNSAGTPIKGGSGGGVGFVSVNGSVTIRNCTIVGNSALQSGGGIAFASSNGQLTVQNSTITSNTCTSGSGGGIASSGKTTVVQSSIVSGNDAGQPGDDIYATGHVIALDNSAVGDSIGFTFTGGNNLSFGLNLNLGPLANNGGPTLTRALLPGSPAINAGSNPVGLTNDQRGTGFARIVNGSTDIGAFEVQASPPRLLDGIINGGLAQRSRVTQVKFIFNTIVTLPANPETAFQLKRNSDNATIGLVALVTNGTTTDVNLTFTGPLVESGSLPDGRYTLTILASQVTANGFQLDGNGDGVGGDNHVVLSSGTGGVFRLFGDADGDANVAANDFIQFRLALGGSNPIFDFDGDGAVAASDFIQFRLRFGGSI